MRMKQTQNKGNLLALLPLAVFIFTFLGSGILLNDFYALPSSIAVILGIVTAFVIFKDTSDNKVSSLIAGCGDSKIITMCLIYLLAGAFATVSTSMGGVAAVVNLGIENINSSYFPLGIFLIAAFLSTATGTSVGSIVALGPIAISLADKSGASLPLIGGSLLGGAMFGDNLSMISDTTIAATQSLECKMKDKFKVNLFIALPAALFTIIVLLFLGYGEGQLTVAAEKYELIAIVPYVLVIVLALIGINVFYTLFIGILSAGLIGFISNDFTLLTFSKTIYQGFTSMTDIFLLSMLTGGLAASAFVLSASTLALAALVEKAGGITYLLHQIKKRIKTKKSAQMGIGALVGLVNVAIANNTVSIVVTGGIAKEINDDYELNPKKTATILDIFSCIFQGLLPYGAQVLLIISFSKGSLSWSDLFLNAWYYLFLFLVTLLAIYSNFWDRIIMKYSK